MSSPAAHDVAPDQAQLGLPMPDQETTAKEDHGPTAPTGTQTHGELEIDFNGTPWEEDIWADREDLVTAKNSIITVSKSLQVNDARRAPNVSLSISVELRRCICRLYLSKLELEPICADRLQRPS